MGGRFICTTLWMALCVPALAALHMPSLFGDNMVLQVGPRTPIYGTATPREVVRIKLGDHEAAAFSNDRGEWRVEMDLKKAEGPLVLEVADSSQTISYKNVLIGEVWLCSGQSNMEWSYHDAKLAKQTARIGEPNRPQIRFFKVKHAVAIVPLHELQGKWIVCTQESMNDFSLLAYFFGVNLRERLGCGVGMIESDWGGTPAEAWTPHWTLTASNQLRPLVNSNFPVPTGAGRETNEKHKPERAASVLYNGMISPLMPYGFRGVAWYQGESNVGRAEQYRTLFPAMINGWRQEAGRDFPFVFVQLAAFEPKALDAGRYDWAELRDAQLAALKLPKTGMATAVDLAHPVEIHWIQREELAKRLTWLAMAHAYGRTAPTTGPVYVRHKVENGQVRIEFKGKMNSLLMRSSDGLCGFEVAGEDKVFHKAIARIERGTVIVQSSKVPKPVAVRYAWSNAPEVSLYNSAGLPAIPFRTDDWDN